MEKSIKTTEEKHEEAVKKIQEILDEYGLQLGITGIVLIPK